MSWTVKLLTRNKKQQQLPLNLCKIWNWLKLATETVHKNLQTHETNRIRKTALQTDDCMKKLL